MPVKYLKILENNEFYQLRKKNSESKVMSLTKEMKDVFEEYSISIFTVGSIGRSEVGENSDLDLFILSKDEITQLEQIKIYAQLIKINSDLGFPEFSNDGQFLTIHQLEDLKNFTGSPEDDSQNLFTTRMLMILESKVLYNEELYTEILKSIIEHYLRDKKSVGNAFKPIFLLNDILRFWRTLCLNYEVIRHDESRPWRKKNINLKYSRMLTIYSTVLALIVNKDINTSVILNICNKTPLERFSLSLEIIDDKQLGAQFDLLLGYYKIFLEAKEDGNIENDIKTKKLLNTNAEKFSDIIYNILSHDTIDKKIKKFLTI